MSSKHKSEDYKLSAVKYYLRANKTQEEVCNIFGCSSRSLMRWVERYNKEGSIKIQHFNYVKNIYIIPSLIHEIIYLRVHLI